MLRSFFIYLSKAAWARKLVTGRSIGWRMAARFIAGEKLEDAIRVTRNLNARRINATLDHLGEHTASPEVSRIATRDIQVPLDAIQSSGIRANVSIKLTQIGLSLDLGLCAENLEAILTHAKALGNFIRVDMEDSKVTQVTLDLVHQMRKKGFDNVGVVIQAYLYRSEEDVRHLAQEGIPVRLCKGAYKEPAEVAYPHKKEVDASFDRLADILLQCCVEPGCPKLSLDGRFPPLAALATHDEKRIKHAIDTLQKLDLPKEAIEFQMLYGIRRDLQQNLAEQGYPVRIYVPYGTEWYPYYIRRLGERPANVWFIFTNLFRK